jgi:ribosomal protein S13
VRISLEAYEDVKFSSHILEMNKDFERTKIKSVESFDKVLGKLIKMSVNPEIAEEKRISCLDGLCHFLDLIVNSKHYQAFIDLFKSNSDMPALQNLSQISPDSEYAQSVHTYLEKLGFSSKKKVFKSSDETMHQLDQLLVRTHSKEQLAEIMKSLEGGNTQEIRGKIEEIMFEKVLKEEIGRHY